MGLLSRLKRKNAVKPLRSATVQIGMGSRVMYREAKYIEEEEHEMVFDLPFGKIIPREDVLLTVTIHDSGKD